MFAVLLFVFLSKEQSVHTILTMKDVQYNGQTDIDLYNAVCIIKRGILSSHNSKTFEKQLYSEGNTYTKGIKL